MVIFDGGFAQNLISWQDTFSNQSGNSLNYKLNVELAPMSFRMASFSPMNARTGFVADVLVNGVSVWHSAQTFARQGQSNSSSSEGFDMGDATEFGDLATQVSYEHSGYRGLVDLGTFAAGQTATVTYRFSQFTYLDKRRDCTIFCAEVFAAAEKTGVNQQRIISAPVPEPESYAMLLGGLGLIGAIARRRKAAAK
ncbi:PEP-CTERM sorting domain-containing protein [Chitinimonas arctica]|uniref:PEP-CTERM sorting domain-containing protein n=2 Tax=Chitinimonas arctica TaxID=2594795 RepID=A0A516SLZ4_9NEIS|nr:PEP-CTERM sorting domain-containing protein [Chitinimonas arctica]